MLLMDGRGNKWIADTKAGVYATKFGRLSCSRKEKLVAHLQAALLSGRKDVFNAVLQHYMGF
jgi:hypothetical protein